MFLSSPCPVFRVQNIYSQMCSIFLPSRARQSCATEMENCSLIIMSFANDRAVAGVLEPSAGVIGYCRSASALGVCPAVQPGITRFRAHAHKR